MATAGFSKFADISSAALSQHHKHLFTDYLYSKMSQSNLGKKDLHEAHHGSVKSVLMEVNTKCCGNIEIAME